MWIDLIAGCLGYLCLMFCFCCLLMFFDCACGDSFVFIDIIGCFGYLVGLFGVFWVA